MPKVRNCNLTVGGAEFTAALNVNSAGSFSIRRPGTEQDWPHVAMLITGTEAEAVERLWKQAVRDWSERTRSERKVILVRFDSILRVNGKRNFFNHEDMLILEANVAREITTDQGDRRIVTYVPHPDVSAMHSAHPFPSGMTLSIGQRLTHLREDICVVAWSQPLQDTIARACRGVQAVVDMLDAALTSPEGILRSAESIALLPQA